MEFINKDNTKPQQKTARLTEKLSEDRVVFNT